MAKQYKFKLNEKVFVIDKDIYTANKNKTGNVILVDTAQIIKRTSINKKKIYYVKEKSFNNLTKHITVDEFFVFEDQLAPFTEFGKVLYG